MMLLKSLLKVTPLRSLHHGLSAARPQEWLALLHLVRDLIETGIIRKYGTTFYIGIVMVVLPYIGPW